jgi:hypothetical protein
MNDDVLSRRNVLRGAMVLCCGIGLPILVSGCNSKTAPTPTAKPIPASPPPGGNPSVAAPAKVPPASVQYQPEPKGDQKCSTCVNFIAESNTCKLVEGQVSPQGWCSLWMLRA